LFTRHPLKHVHIYGTCLQPTTFSSTSRWNHTRRLSVDPNGSPRCPSMANISSLPFELLQEIIQHIYQSRDFKSLQSCSLTSHIWHFATIRFLFETLECRGEDSLANLSHELQCVGSDLRQIIQHTRSLHVQFRERLDHGVKFLPSNLPLYLPNLNFICLSNVDSYWRGEGFIGQSLFSPTFQSVKKHRIRDSGPYPTIIYPILHSLPCLSELIIVNSIFIGPHDNRWDKALGVHSQTRLTVFSYILPLYHRRSGVILSVLKALLLLPTLIQSLQFLSLRFARWDLPCISRLLKSVGSTLKHLQLNPSAWVYREGV